MLFLLETIENPLLEDEEERVPDAFLNMILAFNQHFPGMCVCAHTCACLRGCVTFVIMLLSECEYSVQEHIVTVGMTVTTPFTDPSTNLVMKALRRCSNPRNFSEKLMFLVNRGGVFGASL